MAANAARILTPVLLLDGRPAGAARGRHRRCAATRTATGGESSVAGAAILLFRESRPSAAKRLKGVSAQRLVPWCL
jgi:hypothetical protein